MQKWKAKYWPVKLPCNQNKEAQAVSLEDFYAVLFCLFMALVASTSILVAEMLWFYGILPCLGYIYRRTDLFEYHNRNPLLKGQKEGYQRSTNPKQGSGYNRSSGFASLYGDKRSSAFSFGGTDFYSADKPWRKMKIEGVDAKGNGIGRLQEFFREAFESFIGEESENPSES